MAVEAGNFFGTVDYIVFGLLITVSVAIGLFFAFRDKKRNTTVNYFLGNRQLRSIPLGLSFVVTFQSSILILGFPAEAYVYGMQYSVQCIGVIAGYLLATVIAVPLFHPLQVTSVYEYYKLRYGTNAVRYVGAMLGMIYYTFYMGIVLYGTALALESAAGLPLWATIVIFSSSAIFYTSLGGIKAVIWTDVFQSLVMLSGILAVLIQASISAGGPSEIFKHSKSRMNFFDFNPDPTVRHTFWTLVVGSPVQFFYLTITQAGIQRINSTPNVKVAKRLFYVAAPIYSLAWILVMFQGLTMFAYYNEKGCDPLASGQISNPNQIVPFTILELFSSYPGLPGIFIAALAAASLSTISSGLSSLACITCQDFLKVFAPSMLDNIRTNFAKLFVVLYGLIAVGFAFMLPSVSGPLGEIMASFMGAIAGPETGVFLCSVFFRRTRVVPLLIATCIGFGFSLWIMIGQNFSTITRTPYLPLGSTDQCPFLADATNRSNSEANYSLYESHTTVTYSSMASTVNATLPEQNDSKSGLEKFYSISYMYFQLIGTVITVVFGIILSLIKEPKNPPQISDKVILPLNIFVPRCIWRRQMKGGNYDTEDKQHETETML